MATPARKEIPLFSPTTSQFSPTSDAVASVILSHGESKHTPKASTPSKDEDLLGLFSSPSELILSQDSVNEIQSPYTNLDDTVEVTESQIRETLEADSDDDFECEIEFKTVTISEVISTPVDDAVDYPASPVDSPSDYLSPSPSEAAPVVTNDEAAAPTPTPAPSAKSPCMKAAVTARRVTRSVASGSLKGFSRISHADQKEQEEETHPEAMLETETMANPEPSPEPEHEPVAAPSPKPTPKSVFSQSFARVSMAQERDEEDEDEAPTPTPKKTFTFSRVVVQPTPTPKKRVKKVKKSTPKAATPPKRKPFTMKPAIIEADDKAKQAQAKAKARLKARAMANKKKKAAGSTAAPASARTRGRSTTRRPVAAAAAAAAPKDAADTAPAPPPTSRLLAPTRSSFVRAHSTPANALPPPESAKKASTGAPRSMTVAKSPKFRSRARSAYSTGLSSEEIEYRKAMSDRAEIKMKMKTRNKYKDKAAFGIMGITQAKAKELQAQQQKLTVPTSPDLPTSRKYGHKNYGAMGTHTTMNMVNANPISFANNSPTHNITSAAPSPASSVSSHRTLETTVPEPFNFSSSTKRRPSVPANPRTPPINETVHNFFNSLHSVSRESSSVRKVNASRHGGLTDAQSPQFVTKARASTRALPKSTAELEEEIMERFRKNPFKARVVNQKVMSSQGDIGVPKTRPRGLTEPKGPSLRSDARAANPTPTRRAAKRATSRNNDLDSSFSSTSSRKSTASSACKGFTTPKSPNLSTSKRARRRGSVSQTPTFSSTKKTLDLSSAKKDGKTIAVPFNLRTDVRGSATKAKIEREKFEREEEAVRMASSFKAKPIVTEDIYSSSVTPQRTPAKLTSPKPFNLASERLHEAAQAELQEKIERENQELELQMSAKKANPVPETTYRPDFTPKASHRAPLEAISPELLTRSQAKNRAKFDEVNKERMSAVKAEETMIKARKEQEEQEEMEELRRLPVSEGGLMQEAKPIVLQDLYPCTKVEEKILTEPVFSPSELRTSLRAVR